MQASGAIPRMATRLHTIVPRPRYALLFVALVSCGCTHVKLQQNTLRQGSTLSDLQYQQVLDNLAMFACDPNALAWHVKVTGGLVQVADQGNAFVVPSGVRSPFLAPNVGASRNVLGQWNVDAVIESDDLELLQLAYQKAVNPADPGREIKKEVFEKIAELSGAFQIVLAPQVADEMVETFMNGAGGQQLEKLQQARMRLAALYRRLEQLTGNDAQFDPRGPAVPGQGPNQTPLIMTKREIVQVIASLTKQPFIAGTPLDKPQRGPTTIEQAEDKISALVDLVTERGDGPNPFATPWLGRGATKKDVPKCVCYVGHYCGCQCESFVWVGPEQSKTLRDFTLIILALVPPEVPEVSPGRLGVGAAFSPGS